MTTQVVRVDPKERILSLAGGGTLPYDRLLIATGARAVTPPYPGIDLDGVVYLDTFDGTLDVWFLSSRLGWHRTFDRHQVQLWGGIGYTDAKRTLTIKTDLPVFGPTTVEVEQEPVDPVTYQFGGRLSLNRRWDLMAEVGSNFDDASMLVLSATFRF